MSDNEGTLDTHNEQEQDQIGQEQETPSVDPVVEKAMSQGWVEKEDWVSQGKDPADWRDAQTFVDKGELFERISKQNRELRQLKENYEQLSQHHAKVREMERAKALQELKRAKAVALENGDYEAVTDVDEKILDIRQEATQEVAAAPQGESYEFLSFKEKNPWYGSDTELTEEADTLGVGYATRTGKSEQEVLTYVEKTMKRLHPDKFGGAPKAGQATSVGTPSTTSKKSGGTKKYSERDLTFEQKSIAKRFVQSGALKTVQEYVDQLVEIGELG